MSVPLTLNWRASKTSTGVVWSLGVLAWRARLAASPSGPDLWASPSIPACHTFSPPTFTSETQPPAPLLVENVAGGHLPLAAPLTTHTLPTDTRPKSQKKMSFANHQVPPREGSRVWGQRCTTPTWPWGSVLPSLGLLRQYRKAGTLQGWLSMGWGWGWCCTNCHLHRPLAAPREKCPLTTCLFCCSSGHDRSSWGLA